MADSSLMQWPSKTTAEEIYGESNLATIKMVTLAPELPGTMDLIGRLTWQEQGSGIVVSLGHSNADYKTSAFALMVGATALTHVFNAMPPLNHRDPGLAGTIASKHSPYYSIIADGIHLHPSIVAMAYRADPERCMLITDSIEMAGMPDGIYPGHAQIPLEQQKTGSRVTIKGTDTLIGSCIGMDECVRNLKKFAQCTLAQAVRCATENIAHLMELNDRGTLQPGKRADLVILDKEGNVKELWIKGRCVNNPAETPKQAETGADSMSVDVNVPT
jgi:N-acetylglucosamine-6-phosphate deacetylase